MSSNTAGVNRRIVLARRPKGKVTPDDFRLEEVPVAPLANGEFLVRNLYLSLDPYMRGRMDDAKSYAKPVAVGEVMGGGTVGEVVDLYRLAEEGCEVELVTSQRAFGAARKDEVKEVMVNLLENARNAGATRVKVRVGPGEIRVSDDGSGIPPDLLPRIFEPRFSTTTSGSGLGLAIVKRLVESWSGRIEVESAAGQGTTITVHLPV